MKAQHRHARLSSWRRRRPDALALAAAVALAVGVTAVATAQSSPQTPVPLPNTEFTPVARSSDVFKQIGGAKFADGKLIDRSPTPATADLFTVDFRNADNGLAGGAGCADPQSTDLTGCPRVPVLYEHTHKPGEGEVWRKIDLPGGDKPGFVGAVTFMGPGRALAVGGTGRYPRREQVVDADHPDVAGAARAWLLRNGRWTEITDTLPTGMGGLTAVAASPRKNDCGGTDECLIAGGYRQLWMWRDGGFFRSYTHDSPPEDFDDGASFAYRVRQIRFVPAAKSIPAGQIRAVAVTSGCCAAVDSPVDNQPRMLVYDGLRWAARLAMDDGKTAPNELDRPGADAARDQARPTARTAFGRQGLPDSYYSVLVTPSKTVSLVLSSGEPPGSDPLEPVSRIVGNVPLNSSDGLLSNMLIDSSLVTPTTKIGDGGQGFDNKTGNVAVEALNPDLSEMRLVAGDGDNGGLSAHGVERLAFKQSHDADGVMDWAVGELRDTGQGIAYTTLEEGTPAPSPLRCPGDSDRLARSNTGEINYDRCQADPKNAAAETESRRLIGLPTYALNGFNLTAGIGWAVGDRGALVRLGGGDANGAAAAGDVRPPALGRPEDVPTQDTSAFDAFRPVGAPAQIGEIPPLGERPLEQRSAPSLVPSGVPWPEPPSGTTEGISNIVMSRDGNEGWAVGAGANGAPDGGSTTTLFHYVDQHWSRCDMDGVEGVLPADPACASLRALPLNPNGEGTQPVRLIAATRVPYENDSDPSNDDEFEVAAIGGEFADGASRTAVLLRYKDGRWQLDAKLPSSITERTDIGFTTPDDGWIATTGPSATIGQLWHFDGQHWTACLRGDKACGDAAGQLPLERGVSSDKTGASVTLMLSQAGRRLYLAGNRSATGQTQSQDQTYPVVLFKDPGKDWSADESQGGYDPLPRNDPGEQGVISAISVAQQGDGYVGWALGRFGSTTAQRQTDEQGDLADTLGGSAAATLRLKAGRWAPRAAADAADDYFLRGTISAERIVTLPGQSGAALAFAQFVTNQAPLLRFDPSAGPDGRWVPLATPFDASRASSPFGASANPVALGSDGQDGAWLGVMVRTIPGPQPPTVLYHYSDRVRKPVFDDVPHPVRESITSTAAGADGSVWVTTAGDTVYRYDRLTGWERLRVSGWEATKLVTRGAEATAVAVGPDGHGLIVGEGGRIADVSPTNVRLDDAAGTVCATQPAGACGTAQTLRAAAVAPDGAAMAAGDRRALLWRPAGGEFRAIPPPGAVDPQTRFTGVSMPRDDRAYLAADSGQLFAGQREGEAWSWRQEDVNANGDLLSVDTGGAPRALRAVAVGNNGHGYAVGDQGVILERNGDGPLPWRRLAGYRDNFTSVALPALPNGSGALIGAEEGLILTLAGGRFQVAREADPFDPLVAGFGTALTSRVVGLALLPGSKTGDVEAWAALQAPDGSGRTPAPQELLHYTSNPDDALLSGLHAVRPLPDAPAPRKGEISFAAFGRSDCHLQSPCPEPLGTNLLQDVVSRRITDEVTRRSSQTGGPQFALFTGDIDQAAGRNQGKEAQKVDTPIDQNVIQRRWVETVANRFKSAGLPFFGALGEQDLSEAQACVNGNCHGTRQDASLGRTNLPWRQAMAGMPAPWGTEAQAHDGDVQFVPVADGGVKADSPVGGGANTHYAFDLVRDGDKLMRVVVLDTSLKSMTVAEREQQPVEAGGQTKWLDTVLCRQGDTVNGSTSPCTRGKEEPAIAVSNTPTYSYGPGGLSDTQTDGAALEAKLLQYGVSTVVSGRLGWNGRYFATAAGVHYPCPGGSYPGPGDIPKPGEAKPCQQVPGQADQVQQQIADQLQGVHAPVPVPDPQQAAKDAANGTATGLVDFVVASGGGGRLANETGAARDGYWQGYTIVRLDKTGNPGLTVVEQRPLFDWIGMTAPLRVVHAGGHMKLNGYGREPVGTDQPIRYDTIDSPAITHRYDLVRADPQKPYEPQLDADGNYVPLPASVATIDQQTGDVHAGKGNHERTYAVAILSVDDKGTSLPLAFEPRRSFIAKPPVVLSSGTVAHIVPAPARPAPIVLGTAPASLPSPPPTPPPSTPGNLGVNLPPPPVLNAPPPLTATPTASPPPPPPPPPPPAANTAIPLALSLKTAGLNIAPQTSAFPPPAPPVNPAPPSGARREARQRQAAVAKSEQGSGQEQGADAHSRQDPVDAPGTANMTRHDEGRAHFTAVANHEQPSAWARGALYGGSLTLMALTLALGWVTVRPTPRRRQPELPAPAWARRR